MAQVPEIRQLLVGIIRSVVEDEDAVFVEQVDEESLVTFRLTVAPYDVPKVFGRHGRTVKAIRLVLRSVAPIEVKLEVVESLR